MHIHVPMADLALVADPAGREDPITILERQAQSRLADLIPVRYQRMSATPFTFYRGAAAIQAADLAATPNSGIMTQLCGDAHLSNFGVFRTPERRMIFDINDFDETHPGPFEWDVKRLAASFVVAGRGNGFSDDDTRKHAREVAKSYQKWMQSSIGQTTMQCWYARIDVEEVLAVIGDKLDSSTNERTAKALAKARHRDSSQAVSKLCRVDTDGSVHILSDPPLLVPVRELFGDHNAEVVQERIADRLDVYRNGVPPHIQSLLDQFTIVDIARKVVGVGSVGTRAWIALLSGRGAEDPLFLQIKEAQRSVISNHIAAASFPSEGERVVEGQRLMQAASDLFLGTTAGADENGEHREFYVRQLRDGKGSAVIEAQNVDDMKAYARLCGRALAHAHARTVSRYDIAAYLSSETGFADAITEFAQGYADLNESDHAAMMTAIADGRIEVAALQEARDNAALQRTASKAAKTKSGKASKSGKAAKTGKSTKPATTKAKKGKK